MRRFQTYIPIALLLLIGCHRNVEKVHPDREDISESVYASGLIKAVDQYEAYASANGIIQDVFLKEGDSVAIGTPILSIYNESTRIGRETAELARVYADRRSNKSRLESLQATISLARSKWQNDSLLFVRQQHLFSQKVGTQVELEQRKLALESSRTAYVTAQLQFEDLKRDIEFNDRSAGKNLSLSKALEGDLVLRSKVKGRIYALLREKGEMVNLQTPLAVLGRDDAFYMELRVDEYDIARLRMGQEVLVNMDSYKGQVFKGKVSRIYPFMDERSRTFNVEAVFENAPPLLYPNLSLEANIVSQQRKNTLTLPRIYLLKDSLVISVKGDTIPVKVGLKDYQKVEILSGIDETTEVKRPGQ